MTTFPPFPHPGTAHLRIARPTRSIEAITRFYCEGLGFQVLDQFQDHDGFDGVMLGSPGGPYHLEFTRQTGRPADQVTDAEHLLVFYLPENRQWSAAVARLEAIGCHPVASVNPYWDRHGRTYEDPDGYRVVFQHAPWPG